jgi:hypothetical protein
VKLEAFKMALDLAQEDEALAAAVEGADSLSLSIAEDGSVTIEPAGGEPVVIDAAALMGDDEEPEMDAEMVDG